MPSEPHRTRGPLWRLGHWLKRTATFLYGPADLPDHVDPLVQMDREAGAEGERTPPREPRLSERQQAYESLPREHE